ncbi:hypothetical protein ACJX0J_008473, partial [Zea mays]
MGLCTLWRLRTLMCLSHNASEAFPILVQASLFLMSYYFGQYGGLVSVVVYVVYIVFAHNEDVAGECGPNILSIVDRHIEGYFLGPLVILGGVLIGVAHVEALESLNFILYDIFVFLESCFIIYERNIYIYIYLEQEKMHNLCFLSRIFTLGKPDILPNIYW